MWLFLEEGVFMMSQQAPVNLVRISHHLKGRLRYQNNPVLVTGSGRLILLFVVSILLTFWFSSGYVEANMLFQSPASPPAQPPVEQPSAAQPAAEQPSAEQPAVEQPSAEQSPVEQPSAAQPAGEQPSAEQPPAQPSPAAGQTVVEPALAAPTQPEPVDRHRAEAPADEAEADASSNFIVDQAEFIDTVVISGAYVWLCCGVGALLLVPLVLLFVYIRGRSKIVGEGY
jgi:hypothetical protein